jgi:hypothetical protein
VILERRGQLTDTNLAPNVGGSTVAAPSPPKANEPGRVRLDLECNQTYYYAVAHRPVVKLLTITNVDDQPTAGDLVVRITLEGATEQALLHQFEVEVPALQPFDQKTFHSIRILPNHGELARLDEALVVNLVVTA